MKVIIKNLKQVTFEIEVPSAQSTVLDLKMKIREQIKDINEEAFGGVNLISSDELI